MLSIFEKKKVFPIVLIFDLECRKRKLRIALLTELKINVAHKKNDDQITVVVTDKDLPWLVFKKLQNLNYSNSFALKLIKAF